MDLADRLETVAPPALRQARMYKSAARGRFWSRLVMHLAGEDS